MAHFKKRSVMLVLTNSNSAEFYIYSLKSIETALGFLLLALNVGRYVF